MCLQASLSVVVSVFMPSAWRSRLHTSLKRSWGRHVDLFPVASSPYKRSFGMRPSFIRVTCPRHRMRLCFKRVSFSLAHVIDQDSFSGPLSNPLTPQYDGRMASSVFASLNHANNQSSHTFGPKNEVISSWIPFYMLHSNQEMYTLKTRGKFSPFRKS